MATNFDRNFYLQNNPDVAEAVAQGAFPDAQTHYQQYGRFEDRDPNAQFDISRYLEENPDVAIAGADPLTHYNTYGVSEGRSYPGDVSTGNPPAGGGPTQPAPLPTQPAPMPNLSSLGSPAQADAMAAGFSGVNENLNTGFGNVGNQLTQTQDQIAQGFASTAQQADMQAGFNNLQNQGSDTQAMIGAGFTGTNQNLQTGFEDAANRLQAGFSETQGLMSDAQSAILGGQNDLSTALSDVSSNLDTYYGGLAGGQEDIQGRVGNLQNDFTDFNDQYTEDTTLANQVRGDIQTGMENSTQQIRQDVGQFRGAAQQGQQRIMEAVGGPTAPAPAPSTAPQVSNTPAQSNPLQAVQSVLQSQGGNMAPNLADQFMEVASAFDQGGNLIRRAQEQTGNFVSREMDRVGQMRVRRFAPSGQLQQDKTVDARSVFQMALNMA